MFVYDEFAVRIVGVSKTGRLIAQCPEGEESADLVLPALLAPSDRRQESVRGPYRDFELRNATCAGDPEELGEALFTALFPPPILKLLDRCSGGKSKDGAPRRVRIRLRFGLSDAVAAAAARLPWELLRRDGRFLALDPGFAIVRAVDAPQPVEVAPLDPPLRVLVAGASPRGTRPLAILTEEGLVGKAWGRAGVALTPLRDVTRRSLREAVETRAIHLLHFMGHGRIDPVADRGSLLFDTGSGGVDEIFGEQVATMVSSPHLRLVVLNACDTAASPKATALAFASAAAAMSGAGVTAVVAMQRPIADSAAVLFGRVLHERLAAGEPLEEAVRRGRIALHLERGGTSDWFAPAVFLRALTGDLFSRSPAKATTQPQPEAILDVRGDLEIDDLELFGKEGRAGAGSGGGRATVSAGNAKIRKAVVGGHVDHRRMP